VLKGPIYTWSGQPKHQNFQKKKAEEACLDARVGIVVSLKEDNEPEQGTKEVMLIVEWESLARGRPLLGLNGTVAEEYASENTAE
jgi:hypothetical protein